MATIICVDGLGGSPSVTFDRLTTHAESAGHRVVSVKTDGIVRHSDRVNRLICTYLDLKPILPEGTDIFFVGHSAGGSAVMNSLRHLKHLPRGVVLLSPALPRGVKYLTPQLLRVMVRNWREFIFGREINLSGHEFSLLSGPLVNASPNIRPLPISGYEARDLALRAPSFQSLPSECEILHMWGEKDVWISLKGQMTLNDKLVETSGRNRVTTVTFEKSGHALLHSLERDDVIKRILKWIKHRSS